MPRLVAGKEQVAAGERGAIRVALEAEGPALALFKTSVRNGIVREAMQAGGLFWQAKFVPMRFSNYAAKLGYNLFSRWQKVKRRIQGQATPFVFTGGWRQVAGEGRVTAVATASKSEVAIRVPVPHVTRPETQAQFRTVPPEEVEEVAEHVAKALGAILSMTEVAGDSKGRSMAVRPQGPRPVAAPPARAAAASTGRAA